MSRGGEPRFGDLSRFLTSDLGTSCTVVLGSTQSADVSFLADGSVGAALLLPLLLPSLLPLLLLLLLPLLLLMLLIVDCPDFT